MQTARFLTIVIAAVLGGCNRQQPGPVATGGTARETIEKFVSDWNAGEFGAVWDRMDERSQGKMEVALKFALMGKKDKLALPSRDQFVLVTADGGQIPLRKRVAGLRVDAVREEGDKAEAGVGWQDRSGKECSGQLSTRKVDGVWRVSFDFLENVQREDKTQAVPQGPQSGSTPLGDSVTVSGLEVRITEAAVGKVPYELKHIFEGRVEPRLTEKELLRLTVTTKNVDPTLKYEYLPWQDGFGGSGGANVRDNFENRYHQVPAGPAAQARYDGGVLATMSLRPGMSVTDVVVVEPPIDAAEHLVVTFAFGNRGEARFRIDRSKIVRLVPPKTPGPTAPVALPAAKLTPQDVTIRVTVFAGAAVIDDRWYQLDGQPALMSFAQLKDAILSRKKSENEKLSFVILIPSDRQVAPPRDSIVVRQVAEWAARELKLEATITETK